MGSTPGQPWEGNERHRRIASEGALLGGLIEQGFNSKLIIVSEGAGQLAILVHALCWVHAERLVHKLIGLNDPHREGIAKVRDEIWTLYAELKRFVDTPPSRHWLSHYKPASMRYSPKRQAATRSINCSSVFTSTNTSCCLFWSTSLSRCTIT